MTRLYSLLIALMALPAVADVAEVRLFDPVGGRAAELYQNGLAAKAIQEKAGAEVYVGVDQNGTMHYATAFPNWEAWAKFGTAMEASAEFNAFLEKFFADPPGLQSAIFFVNVPLVAEAKKVTIVYSWDVLSGKGQQAMASAQQAATIHKKLGASAGINIDDLGNLHYELSFDSWMAWAKFVAALEQNKEWSDLMAKMNQDPPAELVNVYRIDQVEPSQ